MQKKRKARSRPQKTIMEASKAPTFNDHALYTNRELSWLEFNQRVLEEVGDTANPLLERVKFLCIVSSHLDEFFEIRVAGLRQQRDSKVSAAGPDGMGPNEQLVAISHRVRKMVDDQYRLWNEVLVPGLEEQHIFFLSYDDLSEDEKRYYTDYFEESFYPVLTSLAVAPVTPFPPL